jgi:glucose/mannose-6-phosphate isomerase
MRRLDPHGMGGVLSEFPAQCREAGTLTPVPGFSSSDIQHVLISGMGGSAAGGDLLAAVSRDRLTVPVMVCREYALPAFVGSRSLVISVSYSGTTEETLSAFQNALEQKAVVAAVTAGGKLGELARNHGCPLVTLPAGLMPRTALGYLFFPLLGILEAAGLSPVSATEKDEALALLLRMAADLAPERPAHANEAKRLALTLSGGCLPVVYGGEVTASAAYRWNSDLEENAKLLALHGVLPEADHNEIVGWSAREARRFHAVFLRDREERPAVARRFEATRTLIGRSAAGVTEVWSRGEGRLCRLLSLIYLGAWVSYYLALLRGVDPWPVPVIDRLKRRLARGATA